jgi:hypothetical protein
MGCPCANLGATISTMRRLVNREQTTLANGFIKMGLRGKFRDF